MYSAPHFIPRLISASAPAPVSAPTTYPQPELAELQAEEASTPLLPPLSLLLEFIRDRSRSSDFYYDRLIAPKMVKVSVRGTPRYRCAAPSRICTSAEELDGFLTHFEKSMEAQRAPSTLPSRETIVAHFGLTIKEAANTLGISIVTLRRLCRQNGIAKWPRSMTKRKLAEKSESAPKNAKTNKSPKRKAVWIDVDPEV